MSSLGSKTISLKIPVNWLWGVALLAAGLIVAFILVRPDVRPILVFSAAVLGGAAGLVTAFNNIDQRAAQTAKAEQAAQDGRVTAALDFFYRWVHPQFFYCKRNGRDILKFFKDNPTVPEQWKYLQEDPGRYANLVDVINTFEALAIAIDKKVVDDETAKRFFRAIVVEYWHQCEGIIKKRRAEVNNPRLLKEFEDLYQRWKN